MTEVKLPNFGDFPESQVIEIAVAVGDSIQIDDPILMLESDKATMDFPSPVAGIVTKILVAVGDKASEGSLVMQVEEAMAKGQTADVVPATAMTGKDEDHASFLVIGGGPGGYTAAFRAADLGRDVTIVDARPTLGGVCLNVGCIPSKALLHIAKLIDDAAEASAHGVRFGKPEIDIDEIRAFKDGVVSKLTTGLARLGKRRKVRVIQGTARFTGTHSVEITGDDGGRTISFDQAVIAVGSEPVRLPFLPDDPRIIDSSGALDLADIPERLLVIGGGIIGLEMAQVYHSLGAIVDIVELADQIIPGADKDVVSPLAKRITTRYGAVRTSSKVTAVEAGDRLIATLETPEGTESAEYDRVLVAVGRSPNGARIGAKAAGIAVDGSGFISTDEQMRTEQAHIFAVGDVVGQPMLAHKAIHEGKIAAEVACGENVAFDARCIPSVAYTDPEVAWVGLTEIEAKKQGIKTGKGVFPWQASGRALSVDRAEGLTKLVFDPETGTVLGAGIVGVNAGELIAEVALAIEFGADAEDLGATIHPHPTLSETVALAADAFSGTITDL